MKNLVPLLALLVILVCIIPVVHAATGHITLLTVAEAPDGQEEGGTADLYLEVQPGEGRIFIDSFPLTRLDTQISARFGKEVACSFLGDPCTSYDFFYTIRSGSTIVGGPSAGAAITLLTISVIGDIPLDPDTVITGTINSGGIIGPVGGVPAKAQAARTINMTKILIPSLDASTANTSNASLFPEGIEVVRVGNIEEALYEFTGKNFSKGLPPVEATPAYEATMQEVAGSLCDRYLKTILRPEITSVTNDTLKAQAQENYNLSQQAAEQDAYYSQASFCFSANLRLTELLYSDYTQDQLSQILESVRTKNDELDQKLQTVPITTLSALETYMTVKERIVDSQQTLTQINASNISSADLAYAVERYYSAVSWTAFFSVNATPFHLERQELASSCFEKLAEAEERINYVGLYIPESIQGNQQSLNLAYRDADNGDYELCLFKASLAKADADVLLSSLFVDTSQIDQLLLEKFNAAERVLAEQESKGIFPVLGYSYFQYAESLRETDPLSSLLYLEYAIELSNLDMYFPPEEPVQDFLRVSLPSWTELILLASGLAIGFIIGLMVMNRHKRKTQEDSKNDRNLPGKKR